ncbi:MAG: GNAT family N-acetyltransferase [Lachnospiraceae bacterium]
MLRIIEAKIEDRDTMRNLLEKYLYEFSQWEKTDVKDDGLYGYEYLDSYFEEENRYPYLIKVDDKLAGLILISDYPEVPDEKTDFCLSEFFIMNKYRRKGYGKEAVFQVLNQHHGKWQLKRHPHNLASVHFWNKIIAEYTNGNYRLVEKYPDKDVDYGDGTPADVFFFDN